MWSAVGREVYYPGAELDEYALSYGSILYRIIYGSDRKKWMEYLPEELLY